MRPLYACLIATSLVGAACSGDDGGSPLVDAGIDAPVGVCGTPATTLSTYPATYSGTTTGSTNQFTVAQGACADEVSYYPPAGLDTAIALTGLTAGSAYLVTLDAATDMSIYVATTCDAQGPAPAACLAFRDQTLTGEQVAFVAPAGGTVYAIVDAEQPSAAGAFTLDVATAECIDDAGCTGASPRCVDYECVQCTTNFECTTAAAPVCDQATNTCVAGAGTCTGDTIGEPDNGPAAARMLTFPTATTPTVTTAGVCGTTNGDDWYKVTAPAAGDLGIDATWTVDADLDLRVYDMAGAVVGNGLSTRVRDEATTVALPAAGTYFIRVNQYTPSSGTPSNDVVAYTLTLGIPACQNDFGCAAGAPVCNGAGRCIAGPTACTGDLGEPDDGPSVARDVTGAVGTAVTVASAACNFTEYEADWYKVTVAAGQGLAISTTFDAANDFDVEVFDAMGRTEGLTYWRNPENVTLTYLPAGTHFIRVSAYATQRSVASVAYTINVTRTAAQTCATATDCAATYETQVYRGSCTAGACQFIPAGTAALGAPCDSGDDCSSGGCSYIPFESDAQKSVCTQSCTTNADCAAVGTGYTCTTGFQTNECVPSCTTDRECGADTGTMPAAGETWSYFVCTTGSCGAP
ncbi:MAG: PPC domain-containing protein [Myxococcales bacterium]|nr:PPC domain-containing protein [Myxococcales bacterium]